MTPTCIPQEKHSPKFFQILEWRLRAIMHFQLWSLSSKTHHLRLWCQFTTPTVSPHQQQGQRWTSGPLENYSFPSPKWFVSEHLHSVALGDIPTFFLVLLNYHCGLLGYPTNSQLLPSQKSWHPPKYHGVLQKGDTYFTFREWMSQ